MAEKTVSDAQMSNTISGLGGYIKSSRHYYCTLTSNFVSKNLVEAFIAATYT